MATSPAPDLGQERRLLGLAVFDALYENEHLLRVPGLPVLLIRRGTPRGLDRAVAGTYEQNNNIRIADPAQASVLGRVGRCTEVLGANGLVAEGHDGGCYRVPEFLVARDDGTDEDAHDSPHPRRSARG